VFVHHDEGSARKPATLSHHATRHLHRADEATRAAFQQKTRAGHAPNLVRVSVDTDRPLAVSTGIPARERGVGRRALPGNPTKGLCPWKPRLRAVALGTINYLWVL